MKSKVGINVVLLSLLLVISSLTIVITPVCATNAEVEVIIGFTNKSQVSQAVLNSGGKVNQIYSIIPAMFVNIPENSLEGLRRNPNVRYIEPNAEVFALEQTIPWGIDRVFGDEEYSFSTWVSSRGSGVTVAVLDTGIANHEDLNVLDGYNAIDNTKPWIDGYGHGTHVAGTIAALDYNDLGVVGVAPDVGLYAVKVLDDSGRGYLDDVIEGIQWSVNNYIDIISMSLGSSKYSYSLDDACSNAYTSGSLLIASAGNSGNPAGRGDNVGYPAKYDSVIAVAATDQNDQRARFSSTGPTVELAAPGVNIFSTYLDNKYALMSGTSMACPHVTGVAALVWTADPLLSNVEVREILQTTAQDLGLPSDYQGYGLVRADLAVDLAKPTEPPAVGSIEGTVTNGTNAIIGATVVVKGTTIVATTNGDGYYLLENVQVGDKQVTASADGYYSQTPTVTVVEDDTVTEDFVLEAIPTYTVSGTVTADSNVLEGATVTIAGTELSAGTNYYGYYTLSDVEKGTYDITASKEGYSSQTDEVTVDSDEVAVDFDLSVITVTPLSVVVETDKLTTYSLNSFVYIRVTVTGGDSGSPIEGANVDITIVYTTDGSIAGTGSVITDSNGVSQLKYKILPKALTGTYRVDATAARAGYETGTGTTTFVVA